LEPLLREASAVALGDLDGESDLEVIAGSMLNGVLLWNNPLWATTRHLARDGQHQWRRKHRLDRHIGECMEVLAAELDGEADYSKRNRLWNDVNAL